MLDKFNREINYLRLSVTERCNLRCRYCMPQEGIVKKSHSDMLTEDEMIMAVEALASLGIKKVRITGGEPLVKKNILSICTRIAALEGIEEVCLTTNGVLLAQYADMLYKAGVKRINISLDTLDREKYAYITRNGNIDNVLQGLEKALQRGFEQIKINTVLIGGFNDDEILSLAQLSERYPIDVRFIELMPMYDGGDFKKSSYISCKTVLDQLPQLEKLPQKDTVAELYRMPKGLGRIGLIRPISANFCTTCNRIRLTADGKLKPCLHHAQEYSLKGLNLEEMKQIATQAIWHKPPCHDEMNHHLRSHAGRNMNEIGG